MLFSHLGKLTSRKRRKNVFGVVKIEKKGVCGACNQICTRKLFIHTPERWYKLMIFFLALHHHVRFSPAGVSPSL